jgi:adenylate cyclase
VAALEGQRLERHLSLRVRLANCESPRWLGFATRPQAKERAGSPQIAVRQILIDRRALKGFSENVTRLWRIVTRVGQEDGVALSHAAWAVAFVLRDLASAKQLNDRAAELNPNLAYAWATRGWFNIWLGQPDIALEHLGRAQRLDPGELSAGPMWSGVAHAYFFLGRYEEAVAVAEQMLRHSPDNTVGLRIGAASAALAGHRDRAHRMAAHLQSLNPAFAVSRLREYLGPYQRPEFVEKHAQGLRLAGLPE